MKNKEEIKLTDFIADYVKAYKLSPDDYKLTTANAYKCSKCGKGYNSKDKFCTVDGKEVVEYQYEILTDENKINIIHMFHYLSENHTQNVKFPYIFIDSVEKRGDGHGYYMNYIFQRKSDNKFFYYTSYDGRIEETTLDETSRKVTTVWDFEKYFD